MKKLLTVLVIFLFRCGTTNETAQNQINFDTIMVNDIIWMADNLDSKTDSLGNEINFYFPNNDTNNIQDYGLLYDFETACKVCPKGWKLPTNEEWEQLFRLSDSVNAATFKDIDFWGEGTQNQNSGFQARPAGYGNNGEHPNAFRDKSIFWSKDGSEGFAWAYILERNKNLARKAEQHDTYAFSVRCIQKNKTTN